MSQPTSSGPPGVGPENSPCLSLLLRDKSKTFSPKCLALHHTFPKLHFSPLCCTTTPSFGVSPHSGGKHRGDTSSADGGKVPLNGVSVGLEVPYFSVALGHSERLLAYERGG